MSLTKASYSMINGAPVNVVDYATGTGTVGDPYVGWDTAIAWAGYTEYYFPKGVFQHSNQLSLAYPGIVLRGSGSGTILKFTGSGECVRFDRGGLTGVFGIIMENFLIKGNVNASRGIYLSNCHHTTFRNISVVDVVNFGFDINFSVLGLIENYSCTVNRDLSTFMPSIGLRIDAAGTYGSTYSTEQLIINPIIEGVAGVGIQFGRCIFSKILNGTSEANGTGVQFTADTGVNVIDGIDCESNSVNDFVINGVNNVLRNVISGSAISTPVYISGTRTIVDGGHAFAVENVGIGTDFINFQLTGGTFTDTGTNTQIRCLHSNLLSAYVPKNSNDSNLFYNGSMESWSAGTSVAPDGWTLSGAGAAVARDAVTVKHGAYSAKLTRSGTDLVLTQSLFTTDIGLNYLRGRQLVFGAWVWASVANTARLSLSTTANSAQSLYHSGNSTWQFLSLTINIPSAAVACVPYIEVNNNNTVVYVDAVAINYGGVPLPYDTRPVEPANDVGGTGSAGAGKQYVSMVVNGITYKVLHDN
jgi:hypothetical protein